MHLPIGFAAVAGKPWRVALVPRNDNSVSLLTLTLTFKNLLSYFVSDLASTVIVLLLLLFYYI